MKCPRDKMTLENDKIDGVVVDICSYCDGIWLDNRELSRIGGTKTDLMEGDIIKNEIEWDEKLSCPHCDIEMEKRYYSRTNDLKIDICPECHGIWLDTGELKTVLEIIGETR